MSLYCHPYLLLLMLLLLLLLLPPSKALPFLLLHPHLLILAPQQNFCFLQDKSSARFFSPPQHPDRF
jgi:hypothetical protein